MKYGGNTIKNLTKKNWKHKLCNASKFLMKRTPEDLLNSS